MVNTKISVREIISILAGLSFIIFAGQFPHLASSNGTIASGSIIFGPEIFTRSTKAPEFVQRTFSVANPGGTFWLQISNGRGGENLVSSAIIRLNGRTIFDTSDFNQKVFGLSKNISLQTNNLLEVEIRGVPDSFITITTRKAFPNSNIENAKDDFRGLNMKDAIALWWAKENMAAEYALFRSTSSLGTFNEVSVIPAGLTNTTDFTPNALTQTLCYKLVARDALGKTIRTYETICVPKYIESSSHELSELALRTKPDTMCLQEFQFTTSTMSVDDIHNFLASRNSFLKDIIPDVDGVLIDPGQEIFNAASSSMISPQVILATLQKEQSAITQKMRLPIDQLRLIMGFDSPSTIRDQISGGTAQLRRDLNRLDSGQSTLGGWLVNVAKTSLDGILVKPAIEAVADLFSYTPYVGVGWGGSGGGNFLFCSSWAAFDFPIPPQPVTNLSATSTATTVTLNWQLPPFPDPDIKELGIFRATSSPVSATSTLAGTVSSSTTTFTDMGLAASTTFFYRVFSVDLDNLSIPSNEVSVTTLAPKPYTLNPHTLFYMPFDSASPTNDNPIFFPELVDPPHFCVRYSGAYAIVPGMFANAVHASGAGSYAREGYIECNSRFIRLIGDPFPDYTAGFWLKASSPPPILGYIFFMYGAADMRPLWIFLGNASGGSTISLVIHPPEPAAATQISSSNSRIYDSQFHNYIFVVQNTTHKLQLYIDGVLDKEVAINSTEVATGSAVELLLSDSTSGFMPNATVDDFFVENRAWTADDAARFFNQGQVPPDHSLLLPDWQTLLQHARSVSSTDVTSTRR